ncbi:hypothetical protein CC86DRAFT_374560 [Ophiobolus disseminans]|uniref:DUF7730 domain-containing protein n=1 Tax=Ophiobolus disseminans TaxID=1469910 RepID=A0A6A6ZH08_9PLEO|nr:hypothetical protein CC86DRAFT_374560 [Ophiobolus disseminans]
MATVIPIPKTMSSPADPDGPSFLTNLPPEMRNAVYEILFKRDGTVLIHNADIYYANSPNRSTFERGEKYRAERLDRFDELFDENTGGAVEFAHCFESVLNLFLTCRQIYHESIGILYGENVFVFSRAQYPRGMDAVDWEVDNLKAHPYLPLNFAPKWFSGIGSHLSLLTKVSIDTDAICPTTYGGGGYRIDILPLALCLWRNPDLSRILQFAATERISTEPTNAIVQTYAHSRHIINRAPLLHRMVDAIVMKDALGLKRYAKYSRILSSVYTTCWFDTLSITYRPTTKTNNIICRRYFVTEQGGELQFGEYQPDPRVHRLLSVIRAAQARMLRILHFACFTTSGVVFDLDRRVVRGFDTRLFQIDSRIRDQAGISNFRWDKSERMKVPHTCSVTFNMSTSDAITNFGHFRALEDLVEVRVFHLLVGGLENHPSTTIALNLNLSSATTLDKIRINVFGLLRFTLGDDIPPQANIRISLTYPQDTNIHEEYVNIPLEDIQKKIFLLLSDFIEHWHNDPWQQRNHAPDIWFNGQGEAINASYPATDTAPAVSVEYKHSALTAREIHYRGYQVPLIKHTRPNTWARFVASRSGGVVMSYWKCLRNLHWGDHECPREYGD